MVTTVVTTGPQWSAQAKLTATEETDVGISTFTTLGGGYVITEDDHLPDLTVLDGRPLPAGVPCAVTLKPGQRLWLSTFIRGRTTLIAMPA